MKSAPAPDPPAPPAQADDRPLLDAALAVIGHLTHDPVTRDGVQDGHRICWEIAASGHRCLRAVDAPVHWTADRLRTWARDPDQTPGPPDDPWAPLPE